MGDVAGRLAFQFNNTAKEHPTGTPSALVHSTQQSPYGTWVLRVLPVCAFSCLSSVSSFSTFFGSLGKHSGASVVGHARKQSAVWQSAHLCDGCLVHNSSGHERYHKHWSHGDAGPNSDTNGQRQEEVRDLDAALRTWLKDKVTHKGFRTRNGHHGNQLLICLQPLCMTLTRKACLSTSERFQSMDRRHFTGTSHLTRLGLAVKIPRPLLAGGENMDEQRGRFLLDVHKHTASSSQMFL